MKKKIFGGIAFAAVALALAFNLSVKQNSNKLSALAMANVEALAQESGGGDTDITKKKWKEELKACTYYEADENGEWKGYPGRKQECVTGSNQFCYTISCYKI